MNVTRCLAIAAVLGCHAAVVRADTFGSGANSFEIQFVTVGNPGNVADTTGAPNPAGRVDYAYRMGKYEISRGMILGANAAGNLDLMLTPKVSGADLPATGLTWFEAAQFVNWLNTSKGHTPAYKFDAAGNFQLWDSGDPGYDPANLFRNSLANYFLPSTDEWYKAAYYDPVADVYYDWPTANGRPPGIGAGTAPGTAIYAGGSAGPGIGIMEAGGPSAIGTVGQGGSVWEWEESEFDLVNDSPLGLRAIRGGGWESHAFALLSSVRQDVGFPATAGPNTESGYYVTGFRVASKIPEPAGFALAALASATGAIGRRRFRQR